MTPDDHVAKDTAFFVAVVVLFSCVLGFCTFTYLGYTEAEHPGLYQLFNRGFDYTMGIISGVMGIPAANRLINGYRKKEGEE